MRWFVNWQDDIDFYENLVETNRIQEKDKRPNLLELDYYVEAFLELSTCRDASNGSPISFTDIVTYANIFDVGDLEEFIHIIRAMDNEYLLNLRKKSKTQG